MAKGDTLNKRERRTRSSGYTNERTRGTASGRKRKKRKKNNKRFLIVILIVIAVIAGILGISYAVGRHFASGYLISDNQEDTEIAPETLISVDIPQGVSTRDIAALLKDNGIIGSEFSFRMKSKINGADGSYNYGTFYLSKDMSTEQIIEILQSPPSTDEINKITIPEGYTAKQIAALVDEKGIATSDEFINEMNNGTFEYEFLEGIPKRENYLEGYLFPDTYFLSGNEKAHDIIVMMLNRFEQIYNNSLKDFIGSTDYTLDQIVTVASMVESEAKLDEERPTIAGVIYNRLGMDMKLQIDSTVQYALSTKNEVVTETDLTVDSPYNTYQNTGLPAGPICNPGEASLVAALKPKEHNYLYYVLKERGGSEHAFAETYDDFLAAKAEYKSTFDN